MLTKLRHILDGVASQEADMKRKTHKLDEWLGLHREALDLASSTKQKLIEFEIISDDDDAETQRAKTTHKTAINESLDALERQLKRIRREEKKHRSRESIQEKKELMAEVTALKNKQKSMSAKLKQASSSLEQQKDTLTSQQDKHREHTQSLLARHEQEVAALASSLRDQHEKELEALRKELNEAKTAHSSERESMVSSQSALEAKVETSLARSP